MINKEENKERKAITMRSKLVNEKKDKEARGTKKGKNEDKDTERKKMQSGTVVYTKIQRDGPKPKKERTDETR